MDEKIHRENVGPVMPSQDLKGRLANFIKAIEVHADVLDAIDTSATTGKPASVETGQQNGVQKLWTPSALT